MKKFIKLIFWASIGVMIIKMVKAFSNLSSYTKVAIFGGINEKFEEIELTDKSYATVFGGVNLDLRKVNLPQKGTTLKVYSRFGGINIKVPKNWNVKVEGNAKQSDINNNTKYNLENSSAPQLTITYDLKFSGMNISIPKAESDVTESVKNTD